LNKDLLKNIKCSIAKSENLLALCEESQLPENMLKCDEYLKTVFLELSQQNKHKVMIAIDEANAFYTRTFYKNQNSECIEPQQLTLVKSILQFGEKCLSSSNTNVILKSISKKDFSLFSTHNRLRAMCFYMQCLGKEINVRSNLYTKTINDNILHYSWILEDAVEDFKTIENNYLGTPSEVIDKYDLLKDLVTERFDKLYTDEEFAAEKLVKLEALVARLYAKHNAYENVPDSIETFNKNSINMNLLEVSPMNVFEVAEILKFYKTKGLIYSENIDGMYLQKKHFVSGGIQDRLYRACQMDNLWDY
jgi:hypothetical protein